MKRFIFSLLISAIIGTTFAQETKPAQNPPLRKVQELDFLIGKWDITFEIYDTYDPTKEFLFTEKGAQECFYDLKNNGEPRFITCRGEVTSSNGRTRTFIESIRYSRFVNSFERTGLFSNWPSTSEEILQYDSAQNKITYYGTLRVQDHLIERYEDVYQFDKDRKTYTRRNIANFSNMPLTQFNLTLTGTGKKLD